MLAVDLLRTEKSAVELPDILGDPNVKKAAKLLDRYYHERDKKGLLSTGSYFDEWAVRGDTANRNFITDSDAVAVSMLSVTVPAKAMVGLPEPETAGRITELLEQIPTDEPLSSLSRDKAAARFGKETNFAAVIDAASAAEIVLHRVIHTQASPDDLPNRKRRQKLVALDKQPLGGLVTLARELAFGPSIDLDGLDELSEIRNDAIHRSETPASQRASRTVQAVFDLVYTHGLWKRS